MCENDQSKPGKVRDKWKIMSENDQNEWERSKPTCSEW